MKPALTRVLSPHSRHRAHQLEPELAVMTTELSRALPMGQSGLDPVFSSCLKLYICDLLSMQEQDSHLGQLHMFYASL